MIQLNIYTMTILSPNQYGYNFEINNENNIILKIKIHSNLQTFRGIIPNKVNKHGYKKYNFANILMQNFTIHHKVIVMHYPLTNTICLQFFDIDLPDGKLFEDNIFVELEEIYDIDAINPEQEMSFSELKNIVIAQHNYINALNDKIRKLEKDFEDMKNNQDNEKCYYNEFA